MKIAGLVAYHAEPIDERSFAALWKLREMCDVLILLCDRCVPPVSTELPAFDDIIALASFAEWHDYGNRLLLLSHAAARDCNWVVWQDWDESFDARLTPQALKDSIRECAQSGLIAIEFKVREMWNETHYRSDGIWATKSKTCVQKNPMLEESIHWRGTSFKGENKLARWHRRPLPCGDIMESDFQLLHWGMVTPEMRKARAERYETLDPKHEEQSIGYQYLNDPTGLELTKL